MGLREDALAAAEAARAAREAAARAVLAARFDTASVAALTVADTSPEVVVFTDGTVCLAVRDNVTPPVVTRVVGSAGQWTAAPRTPIDSLAGLGVILAAEDA